MALAAPVILPFPTRTSNLPPAHGFRILLVEDNAVNRKVVDLMLRSAGIDVDIVADGKQALAAHRSRPYDLILMDLQMPSMDGWEATHQIRQSEGKQPFIIALTADVVDDIREQCLKAGMDDYLSKPFTKDQLLRVVGGAQERLSAADNIRKAS